MEGLKKFLYFFYGISLKIEEYTAPVPFEAIKGFHEGSKRCLMVNHDLKLTDDEKKEWEDVFELWYVGMISGFKGMDDIKSVEEFLKEMRT